MRVYMYTRTCGSVVLDLYLVAVAYAYVCMRLCTGMCVGRPVRIRIRMRIHIRRLACVCIRLRMCVHL